tara:strand:- start:951 stop:1157 length:207 start_codon:yes stop_codon:yes gene_type:complete
MYMVAVVTVMGLTTHMAITPLVHLIMVDLNHHLIDRVTIPTDINHTVRGVLAVTEHSTVTEVLEDVRV